MRTTLVAGALLPTLLIAGAAPAGPDNAMPPHATPGRCYQYVASTPVTETYQEQVTDVPEHTATRTVPAVRGEVERTVTVRPGHVEHIHVPSTWRTVTETQVIRPETTHTEVIPAQYEVYRKWALVRPARRERRPCPPGPVSDPQMPRRPSYLDTVCLMALPAEYAWETEHVLRAPGREIRTTIPAETRAWTHQVMNQAAHDEERVVPPVEKVIREKAIIQPERMETYTVPARTHMAARTRAVAPGALAWREVACPADAHPHHHHHQPSGDDGERGGLDSSPSRPGAATNAPGS
jgi:hypothetical protein